MIVFSWMACETVPKSPQGFWLNDRENIFLYFTEDSLFTLYSKTPYKITIDQITTQDTLIQFDSIQHTSPLLLGFSGGDTFFFKKGKRDNLFDHQMLDAGIELKLLENSYGYRLPSKFSSHRLNIGYRNDSIVVLLNDDESLKSGLGKPQSHYITSLIVAVDKNIPFIETYSVCQEIDSLNFFPLSHYHALKKSPPGYFGPSYPWDSVSYIHSRFPPPRLLLSDSIIKTNHFISFRVEERKLFLNGIEADFKEIRNLIEEDYLMHSPNVMFEVMITPDLTTGEYLTIIAALKAIVEDSRIDYLKHEYGLDLSYLPTGKLLGNDSLKQLTQKRFPLRIHYRME